MQEAYQENKEFSDISYWVQGTSDSEISEWWIFGADGQGDLWLFDTQGKVFFYDHDKECMCKELRFDREDGNRVGTGVYDYHG